MELSTTKDVCEMYDESAEFYAQMMDSEIKLPVYAELLARLHKNIKHIYGALIDTACGSGHMLNMYHEQFESSRQLLGIDLSPQMVAITQEKLGNSGHAEVGDMRALPDIKSTSAAGIINFFAIHHINADELFTALMEWHRLLKPGGQLLLACWEGRGSIDYGEHSDVVAIRYTIEEIESTVRNANFSISSCKVEKVKGFPMDAIYLEAFKV